MLTVDVTLEAENDHGSHICAMEIKEMPTHSEIFSPVKLEAIFRKPSGIAQDVCSTPSISFLARSWSHAVSPRLWASPLALNQPSFPSLV